MAVQYGSLSLELLNITSVIICKLYSFRFIRVIIDKCINLMLSVRHTLCSHHQL